MSNSNFHGMTTILLLSLVLGSCSGTNTHIPANQLLSSIELNTAPIIIDVRTESEYDSGHVPGALHLPFYAIWARHSEVIHNSDDPIVVYCEHGPRAGIAKFALWTLGYEHILYLEGHMTNWKDNQLPINKKIEPDK